MEIGNRVTAEKRALREPGGESSLRFALTLRRAWRRLSTSRHASPALDAGSVACDDFLFPIVRLRCQQLNQVVAAGLARIIGKPLTIYGLDNFDPFVVRSGADVQ